MIRVHLPIGLHLLHRFLIVVLVFDSIVEHVFIVFVADLSIIGLSSRGNKVHVIKLRLYKRVGWVDVYRLLRMQDDPTRRTKTMTPTTLAADRMSYLLSGRRVRRYFSPVKTQIIEEGTQIESAWG